MGQTEGLVLKEFGPENAQNGHISHRNAAAQPHSNTNFEVQTIRMNVKIFTVCEKKKPRHILKFLLTCAVPVLAQLLANSIAKCDEKKVKFNFFQNRSIFFFF